MIDFTEVEDVKIDGKTVSQIKHNEVVIWENIKNINLVDLVNNEPWGLNNSLYLEISPQKKYPVELYDENDNLIEEVETDETGTYNFTLTQETPQTIGYYVKVKYKLSDVVNLTWNKRNILIRPLHTGTLYYGHYLRYEVTDEVTGFILEGLNGYIVDGYNTTQNEVIINSNGYVEKQLNNGTKTDTTTTAYTSECNILESELYNSLEYSESYNYQPSLKYNCRISAASTGSECTATHGSSGEYYGKWYKSSSASSLTSALYSDGSVHSYLASSSGSASCKRPEELYAKTDGKDFNGNVKSGTVLAIEYYMTTYRTDNSSAPITVKGFSMSIQLYSGSSWVTKQTLSNSTTLTATSTAKTGTFTSFTPTMSQLNSGYVRLFCYFVANTSGNLGYVYVSQLYPRVWYSPTQTFQS